MILTFMRGFKEKIFIILIFLQACSAGRQDSVSQAEEVNEKRAKEHVLNEASAKFLVEVTDGRLMGIKEGESAQLKGSGAAIKSYGKLMVTDQKKLLAVIKKLAALKKIQLPHKISADKEDGLKDLNAKQGSDFDEKFIKMMRIDHERDIRLFKKAQELKDEEVRAFAIKYLPLIQEHLDKLNAIKNE